MVCAVHWRSDVEAGRLVGAAAVARLRAEPVFQQQFVLARDEIASARKRPPLECPGSTGKVP